MLLAKPTEIVKGDPAQFTLDRNGLSQLSIVQADEYFNDVNNWNEISLVYKNEFGGREEAKFNAALLNPQTDFLVSIRARGVFNLDAIIIHDFDNGYLLIPKSAISVTDFDLTFAAQVLPFLSDWVAMSKIFSLSEDYVAS